MTEDAIREDLEEVMEELWQLVLSGEASPEQLEPLLAEARGLAVRLDNDAKTMLAELEQELASQDQTAPTPS